MAGAGAIIGSDWAVPEHLWSHEPSDALPVVMGRWLLGAVADDEQAQQPSIAYAAVVAEACVEWASIFPQDTDPHSESRLQGVVERVDATGNRTRLVARMIRYWQAREG